MTENEAWGQAFENGRKVGDAEGYARGLKEAVKLGKWEDEYGGKYANPRYRCSACKEKAPYEFRQDGLGSWKAVQALTPSCPNCGARMDGDGDG